jgi:hypothetical protein
MDRVAIDYEPDTSIADVEEPPSRPSRPRTVTGGALTMQVRIEGHWHRRTPDLITTACGLPIATQYSPLRRELLADPLCAECFTPFERRKAAERTARERDSGDKP